MTSTCDRPSDYECAFVQVAGVLRQFSCKSVDLHAVGSGFNS